MNDQTDDFRVAALARHLGYEAEAYEPVTYQEHLYTDGGAEYLVLTDAEADAATREYVAESLWAFRPEFLAEFTGLPVEVFEALAAKSEDANEPLTRIIEAVGEGIEALTSEAISADGRGHFLAGYDFNEIELPDDLYAYRVN